MLNQDFGKCLFITAMKGKGILSNTNYEETGGDHGAFLNTSAGGPSHVRVQETNQGLVNVLKNILSFITKTILKI